MRLVSCEGYRLVGWTQTAKKYSRRNNQQKCREIMLRNLDQIIPEIMHIERDMEKAKSKRVWTRLDFQTAQSCTVFQRIFSTIDK